MDIRYDGMPSRQDAILTDTGRGVGGLGEMEESFQAVATGAMDMEVREGYDAQGPGGLGIGPVLITNPS